MLRIIINFDKTSGDTRAGSLAFTLLLSFIPFMISMAGLIGLLPFSNRYITRVEQYFFTNYIPHGGAQIYTQVKVFLQHSQELSIFGFSSLIVTTYLMLFSVERQLNALWHTTRQNSILNSLRTHTLFLISGFSVIGIMTVLRIYSHVFLNSPTIDFLFDQSLTTVVTIAMFSLVYKFMPSHSVSLKHALIAGITATVLFGVSKQLFLFYSVNLFVNYHIKEVVWFIIANYHIMEVLWFLNVDHHITEVHLFYKVFYHHTMKANLIYTNFVLLNYFLISFVFNRHTMEVLF